MDRTSSLIRKIFPFVAWERSESSVWNKRDSKGRRRRRLRRAQQLGTVLDHWTTIMINSCGQIVMATNVASSALENVSIYPKRRVARGDGSDAVKSKQVCSESPNMQQQGFNGFLFLLIVVLKHTHRVYTCLGKLHPRNQRERESLFDASADDDGVGWEAKKCNIVCTLSSRNDPFYCQDLSGGSVPPLFWVAANSSNDSP